LQVRRLPGPLLGRTATGAVSRLENGWALGSWGFDSLSFRSRRHGRAGKAARCYRVGGLRAARRFESCCLRPIVPAWSSWKDARLLPARAQVRALPPELDGVRKAGNPHPRTPRRAKTLGPRGRSGDDAGPSTRKLRVRAPPGVLADRLLAVGEQATPPVSGTGDRRFDSCQPDLFRNDAR
jgi:hypothetical protein